MQAGRSGRQVCATLLQQELPRKVEGSFCLGETCEALQITVIQIVSELHQIRSMLGLSWHARSGNIGVQAA